MNTENVLGFRLIIAYSHSKVKMLFDDSRMLMKLLLIAHILILMIYVNMGKCKAQQKDYATAESKPGIKFQSSGVN